MARASWNGVLIAESDQTVVVEGNQDAAWYYADPSRRARAIKGYVAFWKGVRVES